MRCRPTWRAKTPPPQPALGKKTVANERQRPSSASLNLLAPSLQGGREGKEVSPHLPRRKRPLPSTCPSGRRQVSASCRPGPPPSAAKREPLRPSRARQKEGSAEGGGRAANCRVSDAPSVCPLLLGRPEERRTEAESRPSGAGASKPKAEQWGGRSRGTAPPRGGQRLEGGLLLFPGTWTPLSSVRGRDSEKGGIFAPPDSARGTG